MQAGKRKKNRKRTFEPRKSGERGHVKGKGEGGTGGDAPRKICRKASEQVFTLNGKGTGSG